MSYEAIPQTQEIFNNLNAEDLTPKKEVDKFAKEMRAKILELQDQKIIKEASLSNIQNNQESAQILKKEIQEIQITIEAIIQTNSIIQTIAYIEKKNYQQL